MPIYWVNVLGWSSNQVSSTWASTGTNTTTCSTYLVPFTTTGTNSFVIPYMTQTSNTTTVPLWADIASLMQTEWAIRAQQQRMNEAQRQLDDWYREDRDGIPMRPREEIARRLHVRDSQTQAETRARDLLLEHLTPDQRASLERDKWFVVEGKSGRRYRVRDLGHTVANIDVLENERPIHRLCGHIRDAVPMGDHLLAQKLALEADEDEFLRIANRHG